jgi:transposase
MRTPLLNDAQIEEVVALYREAKPDGTPRYSYEQIGERFGVKRHVILQALRRYAKNGGADLPPRTPAVAPKPKAPREESEMKFPISPALADRLNYLRFARDWTKREIIDDALTALSDACGYTEDWADRYPEAAAEAKAITGYESARARLMSAAKRAQAAATACPNPLE